MARYKVLITGAAMVPAIRLSDEIASVDLAIAFGKHIAGHLSDSYWWIGVYEAEGAENLVAEITFKKTTLFLN